MRKYLVFLTVTIFLSCNEYKGEKDSITYDSVYIIFAGYGDYETDSKLKILVTSPSEVNNLNALKNQSKINWFPASKSNEFHIRLIYSDSNTGDKLLVNIQKSKYYDPKIEYGTGTIFDIKYRNDNLVDYVSSLIKLDAIKKHKGSLSQEEYDTF